MSALSNDDDMYGMGSLGDREIQNLGSSKPMSETKRTGVTRISLLTAVFKKVVGTHLFFALFGAIGAHFSPPPPRQPHGIESSHIAKLNHAVIQNEFKSI